MPPLLYTSLSEPSSAAASWAASPSAKSVDAVHSVLPGALVYVRTEAPALYWEKATVVTPAVSTATDGA